MAWPKAKIIARSAAFLLGAAFVIAGSIATYLILENQRGKQLTNEGIAAFARHDHDGALRKYNSALAHRMTRRNLALAHAGRGEVYLAQRQFDSAIRDIDEANRLIPNVAEVIAGRAFAYLQKGDADRAVAAYSEAIKLAPNHFYALLNRGKIFLNSGKADAALADLNEAVRVAPNDAEALLERGRAYEMKDDLAAAVASFESAERVDPENKIGQRENLERHLARDLRERGLAADREKHFGEAIALYTEALTHHPSPEVASTILCNRGATHGRMGAVGKSELDYDEAIRLDPRSVVALYNRGSRARELGRLDQALADLSEALRLQPDFAPAAINRGAVFVSQGEFAKANADYDSAIPNLAQLAPAQRCSISEQLARMRATSSNPLLRNGEQAVALARQACDLTQWQNSRCLDTLAAAYAEAGDFPAAIEVQTEALGAHDFPEEVRKEMQQRLALYRQQRPFHIEED